MNLSIDSISLLSIKGCIFNVILLGLLAGKREFKGVNTVLLI